MFNKMSLIKFTYTIAIIGLFLDQYTKYIARVFLQNASIDLGLLRFDLVYNTGAAYGLFSSFTQPLLIIGIIVIGYLIYALKSLVDSRLTSIAYGVILAGALGNTLDRLISGKVTDFINIQIIPVFNVADTFLNIGIACIILDYVSSRKRR